jgi:hypothetical protein
VLKKQLVIPSPKSLSTHPSYLLLTSTRHDENLATSVAESGAINLLVLCIQEPEVTLKRIAANALSEVCKHNKALGKLVVDAGAVPFLSGLITH